MARRPNPRPVVYRPPPRDRFTDDMLEPDRQTYAQVQAIIEAEEEAAHQEQLRLRREQYAANRLRLQQGGAG